MGVNAYSPAGLSDGMPKDLYPYRCHRATLRARLAIAHLLEPNPADA
jgi:hypothetical protein